MCGQVPAPFLSRRMLEGPRWALLLPVPAGMHWHIHVNLSHLTPGHDGVVVNTASADLANVEKTSRQFPGLNEDGAANSMLPHSSSLRSRALAALCLLHYTDRWYRRTTALDA